MMMFCPKCRTQIWATGGPLSELYMCPSCPWRSRNWPKCPECDIYMEFDSVTEDQSHLIFYCKNPICENYSGDKEIAQNREESESNG